MAPHRHLVAAAAALILAAGAAMPVLAAAGDGEVDDLGQVPPTCEAAGLDFMDPSCTVQTRLGTLALSPHVVHAGGTLTGTVAKHCDCLITWPPIAVGLEKPANPLCASTDPTCTWKVPKDAPTSGYQIMTVNIGGGISKDYFAIVGKGRFELAGHVRDTAGNPLAGVAVDLVGPQEKRLVTDSTGQYSAILKRGRYVVTASSAKTRGVIAPRPSRDCRQRGSSCAVYLIQDRTADFVADSSQHIELSFTSSSIRADGMSFSNALLSDTNAIGDPIAGQEIGFSPPVGESPPRALVCGPKGLLYPTLFPASGAVAAGDFTQKTDAAGHVELTVVAGSQGGDWLVHAERPGSSIISENAYATMTMSGEPPEPVPANLPTEIRAVAAAQRGTAGSLLAAPLSGAGPNQAQDLLLDLLARIKRSGTLPILNGVDFAPIHSTQPVGHEGVGILFYPRGMPPSVALTPGGGGLVLDLSELGRSTGGAVALPDTYPTLGAWSSSGSFPHGQPLPGHPVHEPGEELAYFGLPYPPPEGTLDDEQGQLGRKRYDEQCVASDPSLTAVSVHSPVAVVLAKGKTGVGYDARGKVVAGAPGVVERSAGEATIVVPKGSYTVRLSGTGAGPATLVFWTAASQPRVYSFASSRGARGTIALHPDGPGLGEFDGHKLHSTNGIGLRVRGLPGSLQPGLQKLKLIVRDQFGEPVVGALVEARGADVGQARTDGLGHARLPLELSPHKALRLTVTAPGFRRSRVTASVKR